MPLGFPNSFVSVLRCPRDAGALTPSSDLTHIDDGELRCSSCAFVLPIRAGILEIGGPDGDPETSHERRLRDEIQKTTSATVSTDPFDTTEAEPTLRKLESVPGSRVLEFGCGSGRYTRLLPGCEVLAVDISREALLELGRQQPPESVVGRVCTDIVNLSLAPRSFDRALSTLVSNLPNQSIRLRMHEIAAHALKPDGRFVFSTHYFGLRARIEGRTRVGRYWEGGIFREYMTESAVKAEAQRYFGRVRCWPIQVVAPFARSLGLPPLPTSRFMGRLPLVRRLGAQLLLAVAEQPRERPPTDSPGSVR